MKGLNEFQSAMGRKRAGLIAGAEEFVAAGSMILVKEAMNGFQGSHAAGEPHAGGSQPNVVSGGLRRSIEADPIEHIGQGVVRTSVAPRMAYGRRVELGFVGTDRLGRQFNQPGYPFFGPGVDAAVPQIAEKAKEIFTRHESA